MRTKGAEGGVDGQLLQQSTDVDLGVKERTYTKIHWLRGPYQNTHPFAADTETWAIQESSKHMRNSIRFGRELDTIFPESAMGASRLLLTTLCALIRKKGTKTMCIAYCKIL